MLRAQSMPPGDDVTEFAASCHVKAGIVKVKMGSKRISDSAMHAWCAWMDAAYEGMTRDGQAVRVELMDFSGNMLTAKGVSLLLNFLCRKDIRCRVLKLYQNRIEWASDISKYSPLSR